MGLSKLERVGLISDKKKSGNTTSKPGLILNLMSISANGKFKI